MKNDNIALYRKYRPKTFEEVIGQDHIVKAISLGLKSGKVPHAYLLCGPRGIGKTTIARIIASELGSSVNDIYEIDAASNRGIDDVRNIRENVRTLPFDSKYKIYILDEVHMFTKDAWNALLKTIEEPPSHVIFILATTELDKIPETIVSRCQNFVFRKPTNAVLSIVVNNVAKKEGYSLEKGGAELISILAEGAFRDALGVLQKVISFTKNKKICLKDIEDITGAPNTTLLNDFIDALVEEDLEKGFKTIEQVSKQNIDMITYMKMLLLKLRFILMLRYAPETKKQIAEMISKDDFDYLSKVALTKSKNVSSRALSILLESYQTQRNAIIDELPLELALVNILNGEK